MYNHRAKKQASGRKKTQEELCDSKKFKLDSEDDKKTGKPFHSDTKDSNHSDDSNSGDSE